MTGPVIDGADPVTRLAREAARVTDRLRTMPLARLGHHADAAYATAQRLADLAAGCEGSPARVLPRLGHEALGDQVAVTAHDLAAVADPAAALAGADALEALRRSL